MISRSGPSPPRLHYSRQKADAKTVGRELNVQAVVTGRLRQEGETLVISLELVDARDNSLVWSNRYRAIASRFSTCRTKLRAIWPPSSACS